MRVLYVSKALAVAAYRDKLRALAAHAEVTALAPARWGVAAPERGDGATPPLETRAAWLHGHNHLHLYRGARQVLESFRPELVHIDEEPYSAVTLQLARLCRMLGVPALFFAWQNLDKRLPPPFGALRARVFHDVRGGIAGTEQAAEVLRRAGFQGPLAVIPQFGVDPGRFRPDAAARHRRRAELGIGADDFLVGFAGRLVREKGVRLLLPAVAAVPGARLVLLGTGPERRRLHREAHRAGIGDRVHFAGHVPSLEVAKWLPALDALALPSLGTRGWVEQFGRALVEAMACGVPVVGSDSGEIPRVVGDAGRVVPAGDADALAEALRALAASRDLRAAHGAIGRARVQERFTQERIAARTAAFYARLLDEAGR